MQRVYIETTIPSFLTARPSCDVVIAGKQETTRIWWERRKPLFEAFVSPFVLEEAALGDRAAAMRRMNALSALPVLAVDDEVRRIAETLVAAQAIPAKAATDASHIAVATRHGIDFFLTWNCTHIANAQILRRVTDVLRGPGFESPVICTPDELMEDPND